ncbi:MAG: Coenzyme F420 hydrogenase/dehydrogenase, beta subunit C-terminal domain [Chordicoccus sp.]
MTTVCKKDQCAGCMACIDICPTNSITLKDSLDHMDAEINLDTCINCGLCHKVCGQNHPATLRKTVKWLQGWADETIRSTSSSGGFGQALMLDFISRGGYVVACKLIDGDYKFILAKTSKDLDGCVGSKYVKSNPIGIYKNVREALKKNHKVLFIGLPCQVSSMRNFVHDDDNLYTVDLICHGSPSIKILQEALKDYGYDIHKLKEVSFRSNTNFGLYKDQKRIVPEGVTDRYTMAFLRGLCYTENCYSCHYAQTDRVGDLTMGDSWGTEFQAEFSKGISLILCQTEKGRQLLENIEFNFRPVDIENAIRKNHQLEYPSVRPQEREKFFNDIGKGVPFKSAVARAYPRDCLKQNVKEILIKTKILRKNGGGEERSDLHD